ncbi:17beta-hydroxysteroid dehydrogenase [Aphelenchoides besseyi]|nr:17beta-hydroxysteroid dehydrogenase [Aphelenchoides besseyi]KAI6208959.1 17beta-hydroxysteroid dehydrogenase [Aphelenchoides besseyi]
MDSRLLHWVGIGALGLLAFRICRLLTRILWAHIFGPPKDLKKLTAHAKWAVITGATDGIGKAYAFELASKHFDLLLISRNHEKLLTTADQIKSTHPRTAIKVIEFDFKNPQLEDYEQKIFPVLQKLEIGVLVNNVGLAYDHPERIDQQRNALRSCRDMLIINTIPNTLLSTYVLTQMTKRKGGVVVNLSSAMALYPMTNWAVYSASKRYVSTLTEILRKEFADSKVTIQTVHPMFVETKMVKLIQPLPKIFGVSPEYFAHSAVRTIGLVDETCGCLWHDVQVAIAFYLPPHWLIERFLALVNRIARSEALERMNQESTDGNDETGCSSLLTSNIRL